MANWPSAERRARWFDTAGGLAAAGAVLETTDIAHMIEDASTRPIGTGRPLPQAAQRAADRSASACDRDGHNFRMTAPPARTPAMARPRPHSLTELFWAFTLLALQGFGGVLTVVQRELVDKKRWLSRDEFVESWAVAQVMPGPNVVNLGLMLGERYFGLRGAFVATAGLFTFPLLALLALAVLFNSVSDNTLAQGALRGMGAAASGLVMASGLRLAGALRSNVMGLPVCAVLAVVTFVAIALLRLPLIWVLWVVGGVAYVWAWWQLGRRPAGTTERP